MLERDVMRAQQHLDQVHVWGWRWREPYNRLVPERKVEVGRTAFTTTCALSLCSRHGARAYHLADAVSLIDQPTHPPHADDLRVGVEARSLFGGAIASTSQLAEVQRQFDAAINERNALISEAKGEVGIWSTYGAKLMELAVALEKWRGWRGWRSSRDGMASVVLEGSSGLGWGGLATMPPTVGWGRKRGRGGDKRRMMHVAFAGVEEVRDRFWKAYESGKDFAKRMT